MTAPTTPGNATSAPEMISAVIDGVEVDVEKGTLVIRAAEQIGVHIPRFCDHPLLEPVGACRQCLVEVELPDREGNLRPMPKPQPSCVLEVTPGMVVKTQATSPVAEKAQHGMIEFLLVNHPLDCPVCDKGGECPLQNQAMSNGAPESRFRDVKRTFPKPINISTEVLLDRERCVLCQRCTRFSKQISGDPFIDLQMRGASSQIGTFDPAVLGMATVGGAMQAESGDPFASYFSGNTIQICPVGALTSAAYRFRARPFDLVSTPSVCEHCASGCAQRNDHRRGAVMRRLAHIDMAVNEEWNCDKGRFAFPWQTMKDRITSPMVRDHETGQLREASWSEAIETAAIGLAAARDGDFVTEDSTSAHGVGVLVGGHLTAEDAYGYSKFARMVLGTNDIDFRNRAHSTEEAEFLANYVAGQALDRSVTYADLERASAVLLVGFEPEEESPIVYLRLRKAVRAGTTTVHVVSPFATRGSEKLKATVLYAAPGTESNVVQAIMTNHPEVAKTADAMRGGNVVILVGDRAAEAPGLLSSVVALADNVDAKLAWVPRRAGDRGALDAGCMPTLLPGGRPVSDVEARVSVGSLWGAQTLPATAGRDATQIAEAAAAGQMGGLLIAGLDYRDAADPRALLEAVAQSPFVVAMEVRHTPLTHLADVVFPVAPPAEKGGTFINWEGRWRSFERTLTTQALSDVRVLGMLANHMDAPFDLRDVADAHAEMQRLGSWHGTKARMQPQAASVPTAPGPMQAVVSSWHQLLDGGLMQQGEPHLAGTAHLPVARMSADTCAAVGVSHGDLVSLSTELGGVTLPVWQTVMPDAVVWVPAWAGGVMTRELGIRPGELVTLSSATDVDVEQGEHA